MNIHEKLESIRSKPEHIRMRYVWFFVAVSMLFVIILWILSFQVSQKESQPDPAGNNLFNSDIIDQFSEQKKILDDTREKVENSLSTQEKMAPGTPQSEEQNNQSETNLENGTGQ